MSPTKKGKYNRQHVFLWLALATLSLFVLFITIYLITGGKNKESLAQNDFTFTEDFTTSDNLDTGVTSVQLDGSAGEASLYNGYWTHITDRGVIGHEDTPEWLDPANEEFSGGQALKINPVTNEPYMFFVVAKPGLLPKEDKLYFSRYDRADKRWEKMDGTPGREDLSALFPGPSNMYQVSSTFGDLVQFNAAGDPYLLVNRRAGTSPFLFSPWFLRWCPGLGGGSWGNAACSAVGPESLDIPGIHDLATDLALDSIGRPHAMFYDGTSFLFGGCPAFNVKITDLNGGHVDPGDVLEYKIVIKNRAGKAVSGVAITSEMPKHVHGFSVVSTTLVGITDSSNASGGSNSTGLLDISNISLPSNGSGEIVYRVTVDNPIVLPPPPPTKLVNDYTLTRGLNINMRTKTLTVGSPNTTTPGSLACNTGQFYSFFNGSAWVNTTGSPGAENHNPYGLGGSMAMDSNNHLYFVFTPFTKNLSNPKKIIAETRDANSTTAQFKALIGSGPWTQLTNDFGPAFFPLSSGIDPGDNSWHLIWNSYSQDKIVHTAWNPATGQFEKMDGSPGQETLPALIESGESTLQPSIQFAHNISGSANVFSWNITGSDRNFHYLKWDPSLNQWRTHINNSLPETITLDIPGTVLAAFAVDNNNDPYISYADASFGPGHKTIKISTFTPEAVDVTRNVIASKDIDQTDEPIVKAKISWQGESRGYAGGSQTAPAQPFSNTDGRNAYVDVDCSLSNDAGLNWYPVNFNDDFVFPRLGASLRYKCLLDSGTLLDDPVIKNLTINYSTGRKAANLVMTKNVDTNQDGVFLDQGDQVLPGSELTYQIKVTNNGTSPAQDVVFRDQIPAGTTYVPGSTTVDGQAVADQDGKAPFLPPAGLDLGSLPGKNLFQLTWDRGGGQSLFGDLAKFWSAKNIDFSAKEILRALVNFIRQDDSFAPQGSSLKLSAGSATNWAGLSGAVKLSNGQYFTAWKDFIAGNIVGRFFDQDGNPKTGLITISDTPSTGNSLRPVARQLSGGEIVVVWTTVGSSSTSIVMKKLDLSGSLLTPSEIILATESSVSSLAISLDRLSFAAQAHGPIAVDQNNNFYLGLMRKTSGSCPQKAEVVKFDNAGNALWGPVVVSGAACDVMEAPVLAINSAGELMSVHTTNTSSFLHTVSAIVANVLDANGNILSGPTTINGNKLSLYNSGVRSVASLNNHDFVVSYIHNNGSCVGACLQKITYNSGAISFDSPVLIDSSADRHIVVATDQSDQIIVALWLGADGRFHAQAFDLNLAPLGGSYSMPMGFSGYTQDYPSMALDQVNNKIWAVWQESDYDDLIVGNVLNYGPVPHELVSSVYDAGAKTDWQTIKTTTKMPAGSDIKIQVRAGNTGTPDSTWTPFVGVPLNGNLPGSLHGYRYVQYKVIFELTDLSAKPELHDIFIGQAGQRVIEFKVRVNAGTNTVISNLASAGLGSGGSTVNSQSTANQVGPPTLQELYGDNRIDTAVAISQSQFAQDNSADCAILVRADDPIESLTGAPLAAQCGGPILLNPTTHLDSRNIQELKRILAAGEPIYLLGREKALALSLANELAREGFTNVIRRGGRNREATAVEIAKELDRLEPDVLRAAFIANGFKFADPVSAAPAAATKDPGSTRSPILLIKSTGVIKEVKDFLTQRPDIKTVYVIGGQAVAPDKVTDFLAELVTKPNKIRIAGANRFDTSVKVAERFFPVPVRVFVTSGFGFPVFDAAGHSTGVPVDALVSGPLAAKQGAPVLFTKRSKVPGEIDAYLKTHRGTVGELTLIGGPNAIIPAIRQALFDLIK